MSGINLSLPVEIPWKLLATSEDMLDTVVGGTAPPMWRSSIALFTYDPVELPDALTDRRVTYVKVICSITGFQTSDVNAKQVDFGPLSRASVAGLKEQLNRYYACYGALLHVSVHPARAEDRLDRRRYPMIVDFEPKRRDLYEIATDSGEVLSASVNRAVVGKDFTSTASTEDSWALSATGLVSPGVGSGPGGSVTGSIGGKSATGSRESTITQVDHAREKRETQSHATSLTQMYNLFQGYHLGTNRAVFLVQPRPHVLEQVDKRTFINGPREIEGMQELFLVVSRPADMEHICIDVAVDTGHLDLEPGSTDAAVTKTASFPIKLLAPRQITHGTSAGDDTTERTEIKTQTFRPDPGWEVDVSRGSGGYAVLDLHGGAAYTIDASPEAVVVTATVLTRFVDVAWSTDDYYKYLDLVGELTVFLKKTEQRANEDIRTTFFVTTRGLLGCTDPQHQEPPAPTKPEWLSFEWPFGVDARMLATTSPSGVRLRIANDVGHRVGRLMLESLKAKPRYPPRAVDFVHSQFFFDRFVRPVRVAQPGIFSRPITEVAKLGDLATRLKAANIDKVDKALQLSLEELAGFTAGGTLDEALLARWTMIGIGPREIDG